MATPRYVTAPLRRHGSRVECVEADGKGSAGDRCDEHQQDERPKLTRLNSE